MSCPWLEERIPKAEIELWRYGRPSTALLEHARTCEACAETIERELGIKVLLLALSESTSASEAGPSVRALLLEEVTARANERSARRRWWAVFPSAAGLRWTAAAAAIAAGIALAIFGIARRGEVQPELQARVEPVPQQKPVAPKPAVTVVEPRRSAPVHKAKPRPRAATVEAVQAPAQHESDYYPMVMCDSYTCAGDAVEVRVAMPVSPLWRGRNYQAGESVNAQLLVGEDGLVRAIKFVK